MWVVLRRASYLVFRQVGPVFPSQGEAYKEAIRLGTERYKIAKIDIQPPGAFNTPTKDRFVDVPWQWTACRQDRTTKLATEIFLIHD